MKIEGSKTGDVDCLSQIPTLILVRSGSMGISQPCNMDFAMHPNENGGILL